MTACTARNFGDPMYHGDNDRQRHRHRQRSQRKSGRLESCGPDQYQRSAFFTASGEVWRSDDGTDLTTKIVKDIHPGASSSFPKYLTNVGGELYFVASDSTGTRQYLWMSNGNEAGTNPVPGAANSSGSLNSESLISFNGALFFSGTDGSGTGAHGQELWKSDGTGVQLVKDIWPGTGNGSGSSFPQAIFVGTRGGTPILYFVANDGSHGNELWESDGSASGTVMVKDINSGSGNGLSLNGNVVPFASMNGILYFLPAMERTASNCGGRMASRTPITPGLARAWSRISIQARPQAWAAISTI
jgi:ELWxxDGT repeat protein